MQVKLAGEAATTLAGIPNGSSSSSAAVAAAAPAASSSSAASDSTQQAEPAAGAKPKKIVADSGVWNEEQELALVQALKQFGKELPDRWERIAAVVPGKSKAACFKRFKELKEVFKAKKAG